MQSIERYGVVALLFLVVTVVAVLVWDDGDLSTKKPVQAASRPTATKNADATPTPRRIEMSAPTIRRNNKGLRRDLLAERAAQQAEPVETPAASAQEGPAAGAPTTGSPMVAAPAGIVPASAQAATPASRPLEAPTGREVGGMEPAPARPRAIPSGAPETVAAAGTRPYVVQKGDTLTEIAMNELGTMKRWQEIVDANPGLTPERLYVGKPIRLPVGGATDVAGGVAAAERSAPAEPVAAREERATPAAGGTTYTVRSGESLWRIAQARLGDGNRWKEIAELNPRIDPDRLVAGQELTLPSGAAAAVPTVADSTPSSSTPARRRVR